MSDIKLHKSMIKFSNYHVLFTFVHILMGNKQTKNCKSKCEFNKCESVNKQLTG